MNDVSAGKSLSSVVEFISYLNINIFYIYYIFIKLYKDVYVKIIIQLDFFLMFNKLNKYINILCVLAADIC